MKVKPLFTFLLICASLFGASTLSAQSITLTSPSTLDICIGNAAGSLYSAETLVSANASGFFNSGNQFRLELSDQNGSFSSPLLLGSELGNGVDPAIGPMDLCCIPAGTAASPNYALRIVSTNPVTISNTIPVVIREASRPILDLSTTPGNGEITLTWTAPTGCVDNYIILAQEGTDFSGSDFTEANLDDSFMDFAANADWATRSNSNDAFENLFLGSDNQTYIMYDGSATTATITGLTNGTNYYFRVFSVYDVSDVSVDPFPIGDFSSPVDASTAPMAPVPTITITSPTALDICIGNALGSIYFAETSVLATTVGEFAVGNDFVLELSDMNGDFSSPLVIGSEPGEGIDPLVGPADIFFIPTGTPPSANYGMRFVSTDPVAVSNTIPVIIREMSRPVTNLTVDTGDGEAVLSWGDPGGCIDTYVIFAQEGVDFSGSDFTEANLDDELYDFSPNADWSARSNSNDAFDEFFLGTDDQTYIVYAGTATTATISGLTNGNTYHFRVFSVYDNSDPQLDLGPFTFGDFSSPVDASVTPSGCGPIPAALSSMDIGNTGGVASEVCYDAATGVYEIEASGEGIGTLMEGFNFIYRPLMGNGELTVRIVSTDPSQPAGRVGLMARNTLNPGSPFFYVGQEGDGTNFKLLRTRTGRRTFGRDYQNLANWYRIVRTGNSLEGFRSDDGVTWYSLGSHNYSGLPSILSVGVATTSPVAGTPINVEVADLTIDGISYRQAGTEIAAETAVEVFPNPATDQLTVRGTLHAEQASLRLTDLSGRTLLSQTIDGQSQAPFKATISLQDLAAGMYVIQLNNGGRVHSQTVVKQ